MLSESETESKQKNQEKQGPVSLLICFQMDTQYKNWNTQFKIWNTQLSQKEVGKYPIASNPYLELCQTDPFNGKPLPHPHTSHAQL